MATIRKVDAIRITYYVNPHHFYFRYEKESHGEEVLKLVNTKIQKYVRRFIEPERPKYHSPEIGEIVLLHYMSDCVFEWIRARVDLKVGRERFILWAIDYGFPTESDARWIRQLSSDELKVIQTGLIFKGGIYQIVPCTSRWNFIDSIEEFKKASKWSLNAIESVEKYVSRANSISFKCKAYCGDHFFGSLIIQTHDGKKLVARELLRSLKEGVISTSFMQDFSQLENAPYWDRQKHDAIYKVYDNNSDFTSSMNSSMGTYCEDDIAASNIPDVPTLIEIKDKKKDEIDETLTLQFQSATKLSPEMDENSSIAESHTFRRVPLAQRFEVALQKFEERTRTGQRKLAKIDEENKKIMRMSFPAGFIVDNQAIADREADLAGKKKNERYEKAKEYEECFSVSHVQRVLVHDHENIPIAPANEIRQVNFSSEIHSALRELNINQPYRIQRVGWPRILRGLSVIFVNNAGSGKTWTYLPAVCSLLIERIQDEQVVNGCGPLSIIACASSQEVNKIALSCEDFLRCTNGIKCFKAYGFCDSDEVVSQLLNGTEIMITTVPCLHRLMKHELQLFKEKRLVSLVFNNIDLIDKQFRQEICEIYQSFDNNVQMIITSRTWLTLLEHFYIESDRFALCIGSYIEAAIYGKTEMVIEFMGQELKFSKLMSYINGLNYATELTLVICSTPKDLQDLLNQFQHSVNSFKLWKCHDNTDSLEILQIKEQIEKCEPGDYRMLICTDDTLADLNIRRAEHIVHFSLPSTWTLFAYRFSVLLDCHENVLTRTNNYKSKTTSVVFVDEKNNEQLPRLIDFMKMRVKSDIPETVLRLAEIKRIENEETRTNIYKPFCKSLLTIGVCHGQLNCPDRHTITKLDRSRSDIPRSGYVKFDILSINSPVHFTVRLLGRRLLNERNWTKLHSIDEISTFNIELMKYYENEENHAIHFPFKLGDLCAVCVDSGGEKCYARGKIVKIEEKKLMAVLSRNWIEILLVDSNRRESCCSTNLLQLPEKFKSFPFQAVDVCIAGIRSQDFDSEWDPKIRVQVIKWIRNHNHHFYQGFVRLSIMDTLWVDTVDVIEVLDSITDEIRAVSIKRNLLKKNFCVKDSKPFELLSNLADKAGLAKLDDISLEGCNDSKSNQIADQRPATTLFYHSDAESIDVDDSDVSHLTCSSSSDDLSETSDGYSYKPLQQSSITSAREEEVLCLSKDTWDELKLDQFNKVLLCNFYHPNRIYIRNFDSSSRLTELHRDIEEYISLADNLTQLSDVALAQNCLAKLNNKFCRAKILKIFHETDSVTTEVFFVDLGEFLMISANELYQIPSRFISALPFQAIFCVLVGIRPINSASWSDTICDKIYDNFLGHQTHIYARSMQPGGPDKYAYGLKSRSYRVVLLDENENVNVNDWIVSNNFGELDPATKHLINARVDKDPVEDDADDEFSFIDFGDDFDVQFDEEDILKFFQLRGDQLEKKIEEAPVEISEIYEEPAEPIPLAKETLQTENCLAKNSSPNADDKIVELVFQYGIPKIQWHQSESIVVLAIHAPDVKEYYLKINPRFVHICFSTEHDKFAALLNLFGCVDVERTSHEVRGLNIVVKLTKSLGKISWPRLIQPRQKFRWLQYNFEASKEELEFFDSGEKRNYEFVPEQTASSDDESNPEYSDYSDNE